MIKSQEEFEEFIQSLYKQGVEALLKAEINDHLGYPKQKRKVGKKEKVLLTRITLRVILVN